MMHLELSITCPANAGSFSAPSSGWMCIEIHPIIKYDTSLRLITPRHLFPIFSHAIERFGVINCTITFFCSRQVHKRTIGACNTFTSVNESCEKRHYYAKPIKHTNGINKKMILNYYKIPIIIYLLPSMEQLRPRKVKSQELLVLSVPYAPNTV